MRPERDHAIARKTWLDRQRFRPQQWSYQSQWVLHDSSPTERWMGFAGVSGELGLPADILMVPLIGHTLGHAGIAIRREDGWLLQAGDAYFWHREMDVERPGCTPGLRFYQWMMEKDRDARLGNQQRLRELRAKILDVRVMCSHDPNEFEQAAGRAMGQPPQPVADFLSRASPGRESRSPSAAATDPGSARSRS
jgi:glyoxylase-like metal-dependent hydrolase (beta-lactamase superfamily II)